VGLSSHFHVHIVGVPRSKPTYKRAHVGLDLLTLVL